MQVESASREKPCADALYGPGGYEKKKKHITLRMESQEFSTRSRTSEDVARSELEATPVMRHSVKITSSKSQSENTKDRQEMPSIRL